MLDVISDQDAVEYAESVLGAVLLGGRGDLDIIDLVAANLVPEDMPREALGIIYAGALQLNRWGPVNLMTVTNHLREEGLLERVGGASYLSGLTDKADVAFAEWHAGLIRQGALTRRVQTTSRAASEQPTPDNLAALGDDMRALEGWRDRRADPDRGMVWDPDEPTPEVIPLGLGKVGIAPGQLMLIVGPPKMGKSALACQLASHACCAEGQPVLYVSLEMPEKEIWPRLIAPRVEGHDLWYKRLIAVEKDETLTDDERSAIRAAYQAYPGLGRFRVLAPRFGEEPTVDWVASWAEADKRKHGKPPLIVFDYLQQGVTGDSERRVEVGKLIYQFRSLAMNMGVPIIAISSMARGYLNRASKHWFRPGEDTGKESGDITYAISGGQLTLWWPEEFFKRFIQDGKPKPQRVPVELYRDNARFGDRGDAVMDLTWFRGVGRFQVTPPGQESWYLPRESPEGTEIGW